jgi:hypothetical protein
MATQNATGFAVGADVNPFEAAMRRMVDAARGGQAGVGSALGSLATGPLAGLKTAFAAISTLLAGGFMTGAITETALMTEKAMDLGRALGVSTNQARAIQIALEDIGAAEGEFESAAKGMVRQIAKNEEQINAMGLATRDAAGNLRPMNELMADAIKVLGTYKEGTDRMLASQLIFGRGLDASSKLMLYNQEVQDDATATMEKMGLTVGENSVEAWHRFDDATDTARFGVQGMKKAIGDSLMPVATTLVNMFASLMPAAIVAVRGALSGLTAGFLFVKNGVVVLWETINAFIYSVIEPLRGLNEMLGKAMVGDFAGAASAFKAIGKNVGDVWAGSMERMTQSSRDTADQVYKLFSADTAPGSGGGPGQGTRSAPRTPDAPDKALKIKIDREPKEASAMQTYEAALTQHKLVFEQENALLEFSKQRELDYWREIINTYTVGSKDRTAIAQKMGKLELDMLRESAKDKAAITQLHAEDWKAETLDYIAELEARAVFERDEGTSTQAAFLARLAAFHQMRLQAELEFIAQKIEVAKLDPEQNVVTLEQLEMQKLELKRKYAALARDIGLQAAAEQRGPMDAILGTINQSFSTMTTSLLTNWRNLGTALRGVLSNIGQSIIQEVVLKPLQAKIIAWARERALTMASIGANAAEAGSGGASAMASIPYVGPVLAVAAMMMLLSQVGAMKSQVPSAAMGYSVPRGLDPLTQLHEQEMVLPASIANPLRESIAAGAMGAAGRQSEAQIRGMPPGEWLMVHRGDLVSALKTAQRDFAFTKF